MRFQRLDASAAKGGAGAVACDVGEVAAAWTFDGVPCGVVAIPGFDGSRDDEKPIDCWSIGAEKPSVEAAAPADEAIDMRCSRSAKRECSMILCDVW